MKPLIVLVYIATALLGVQSTLLAADNEEGILYWVAPMDPNFRRDKPGKSPMGMDLVPVYADKNTEPDPGATDQT